MGDGKHERFYKCVCGTELLKLGEGSVVCPICGFKPAVILFKRERPVK